MSDEAPDPRVAAMGILWFTAYDFRQPADAWAAAMRSSALLSGPEPGADVLLAVMASRARAEAFLEAHLADDDDPWSFAVEKLVRCEGWVAMMGSLVASALEEARRASGLDLPPGQLLYAVRAGMVAGERRWVIDAPFKSHLDGVAIYLSVGVGDFPAEPCGQCAGCAGPAATPPG